LSQTMEIVSRDWKEGRRIGMKRKHGEGEGERLKITRKVE
jgi:hypothetical protein